MHDFQQLLHLNRAFAVLEIGDETGAGTGESRELQLGYALPLAFRLNELADLFDGFLFFVFHITER